MNTFSACVDAAFQRAKTLLWPIQKNVWLKLFVLFLFTGGCGSYVGNIGNVKSFKDLSKNNTGPTQAAPAAPDKDTMVITSQAVSEFIAEVKGVIKSAWEKYRLYVYAAAAVFFMFLIFFFVVGIWFTSRLEVTLISILREGIVEIGRHWRQTESLGWSLFVFRLWIYALCAIVFLPLIGVGLGGIAYAIKHSMTALAVLFGLGMFFLVVVTIVTSLALWALMKFLPAVMCEFNESPRSGARRMWFAGNRFRSRWSGRNCSSRASRKSYCRRGCRGVQSGSRRDGWQSRALSPFSSVRTRVYSRARLA
jgi:hypothetical protein